MGLGLRSRIGCSCKAFVAYRSEAGIFGREISASSIPNGSTHGQPESHTHTTDSDMRFMWRRSLLSIYELSIPDGEIM